MATGSPPCFTRVVAKHRRVVWGSRGLGCFAIVGTMYEREFSKRPWGEEGGFTAWSVSRSHRANPSDRSVSPPTYNNQTTNPLNLSLSSAKNRQKTKESIEISSFRTDITGRKRRKGAKKREFDCIEARICIVAALDSSNDTKEVVSDIRYLRESVAVVPFFLYIVAR